MDVHKKMPLPFLQFVLSKLKFHNVPEYVLQISYEVLKYNCSHKLLYTFFLFFIKYVHREVSFYFLYIKKTAMTKSKNKMNGIIRKK